MRRTDWIQERWTCWVCLLELHQECSRMWVRRVMTPPCSCIMGRRYLAHEGRRLADRFSVFFCSSTLFSGFWHFHHSQIQLVVGRRTTKWLVNCAQVFCHCLWFYSSLNSSSKILYWKCQPGVVAGLKEAYRQKLLPLERCFFCIIAMPMNQKWECQNNVCNVL